MDGNPEGTPNPLNPMQGTASTNNHPQPSTDTAAGTGALSQAGFSNNRDSGSSTPLRNPVPPASFAQTNHRVAETSSASTMPNIPPAAPRVNSRMNRGVIDPMMRPVQHNMGSTSHSDPLATEDETNFGTFSMDDSSLDQLSQELGGTHDSSNLVAKDSIVEPVGGKKKKKKALIIGGIILLVVALACGAAAIAIILMNNSGDKVAKAVENLFSGNDYNIIEAKGTISTINNDTASSSVIGANDLLLQSSSATIVFDGIFDTQSSANSVQARITADLTNGNQSTIIVEELRNKEKDTFVRVSGLEDLISTLTNNGTSSGQTVTIETTTGEVNAGTANSPELLPAECAVGSSSEGEKCQTPIVGSAETLVKMYQEVFETVDEQWLHVSDDYAESMGGLEIFDNSSTCLINAFSTLPSYGKDLASKYKANPFVTYSTDKLEIDKKSGELFKLGFDKQKLSAFTNSLGNNGFINELNACVGQTASNTGASPSAIETIFSSFPTMYAEVDNNNRFSRFYFVANSNNDESPMTITADIDLAYPKELKVVEPSDYIEMSIVLNDIMSRFFYDGTSESTTPTNP